MQQQQIEGRGLVPRPSRSTLVFAMPVSAAALICRTILKRTVLFMGCALTLHAMAQTVPPDVSSQLLDAKKLLAKADYTGADQLLREALRAAPTSAAEHFLLGFTLVHEQKPNEAIVEYMQGTKLKEPGSEEFIGFGSAQDLLGQHESAERSLLSAAKLAPERPLIWYLLGRIQFEEGHWLDAEKTFLTCLRLDPHHIQAQTNLGLVFEELRRPDAAATAYRAAITLQEATEQKDPQPYLALGMLLRKQGKPTEALPFLTMATYSPSPNLLAHQELGLADEQLRRYDEALGEIKTAVYLDPKLAALHFFLGRIYRETGRQGEAAQEFAKAAALTPEPLTSSIH